MDAKYPKPSPHIFTTAFQKWSAVNQGATSTCTPGENAQQFRYLFTHLSRTGQDIRWESILRIVRVVANAQGRILKITTRVNYDFVFSKFDRTISIGTKRLTIRLQLGF
jgi:hypothetical protein